MMAEPSPHRIASSPYTTPAIAAAIGRSCSSVKRNIVQRNADKSKRENGTDAKSRFCSHRYRNERKNTSSTGAITNALPISFMIVSVQPHVAGSYGDAVGTSGREPIGQQNHVRYQAHLSGAIQRRQTIRPATIAINKLTVGSWWLVVGC